MGHLFDAQIIPLGGCIVALSHITLFMYQPGRMYIFRGIVVRPNRAVLRS